MDKGVQLPVAGEIVQRRWQEIPIAPAVMEPVDGSLILVRPEDFPPLYKPAGAYFDLCAQGRLPAAAR